jgi:vacuolar-type H+-ATPase subunit E/Vma4
VARKLSDLTEYNYCNPRGEETCEDDLMISTGLLADELELEAEQCEALQLPPDLREALLQRAKDPEWQKKKSDKKAAKEKTKKRVKVKLNQGQKELLRKGLAEHGTQAMLSKLMPTVGGAKAKAKGKISMAKKLKKNVQKKLKGHKGGKTKLQKQNLLKDTVKGLVKDLAKAKAKSKAKSKAKAMAAPALPPVLSGLEGKLVRVVSELATKARYGLEGEVMKHDISKGTVSVKTGMLAATTEVPEAFVVELSGSEKKTSPWKSQVALSRPMRQSALISIGLYNDSEDCEIIPWEELPKEWLAEQHMSGGLAAEVEL